MSLENTSVRNQIGENLQEAITEAQEKWAAALFFPFLVVSSISEPVSSKLMSEKQNILIQGGTMITIALLGAMSLGASIPLAPITVPAHFAAKEIRKRRPNST